MTFLKAERAVLETDEQQLLEDINLEIRQGEFFVIMGSNGCGKTVLLKMLAGLMLPTRGIVEVKLHTGKFMDMESAVEGRDIAAAFVFESGGLISNLNVFDNVALPLRYAMGLPETQLRAAVAKTLEEFGLSEFSAARPAVLSSGIKKRVQIARAKITKADVVFYDNPSASLDATQQNLLRESIQNLHQDGNKVSILATGSPRWEWEVADRAAFVQGGRVTAVGTKEELLANPSQALRDFLKDVAYGN